FGVLPAVAALAFRFCFYVGNLNFGSRYELIQVTDGNDFISLQTIDNFIERAFMSAQSDALLAHDVVFNDKDRRDSGQGGYGFIRNRHYVAVPSSLDGPFGKKPRFQF